MHTSEELHGMNTWDVSIFNGGDETNWCSDNKNKTYYKIDIKTKLGERFFKHKTKSTIGFLKHRTSSPL